jgi:hypothetical protein
MDFDEHVANIILNKVVQVAEERNLDEEGLKDLITEQKAIIAEL